MKAGSKPDKGQKSIASFLFKPKSGSVPRNGQPKQQQQQQQPQQRVLGEKQPAQGPPPLAIPAKRQRLSENVDLESQNEQIQRATVLTSSTQHATVFSNRQGLQTAARDSGESVSTADVHALQSQVPSQVDRRHQRFQQKLVLGAGNKAATRGAPAVTKAKYTPLEMQVVELKDKHPGVLLIVEVLLCFCSALSM